MIKKKGWSLRYRPDKKRWVLQIKPPDGSRQWSTDTAPPEIQREGDAKNWAAHLLAQRAMSGPIAATRARRAEGPTVRERYMAWIRDAADRPATQPATVAGYRTAFKAWILPMLGDEPCAGLDTGRVKEWLKDLRKQKAKRGGRKVADATDGRTLSPMRVANTFSALSVFLSDMVTEKKVPFATNPCFDPTVRRELPERPKPGQVRIAGARAGIPTMADGQAAIDAPVEDGERLRFLIAFGQGFRDGEIAGLRIMNARVDADVPHFVICEAVKLVGPTGFATPGKLKTDSSERLVPMHPAVALAIRDWLARGWRRAMHRSPDPSDFLLPGAKGGPTRPKSSKLFRAALKAAGHVIERNGRALTFRSARNAFVTALAEAEVPREVRKLLMGHAADGVDEAHYTTHGLGKLAGFIARLPLRWDVRPDARSDARSATEHSTANNENFRAAPGRVELPTNGLGKRGALGREDAESADETVPKATDAPSSNGRRVTSGREKRSVGQRGRAVAGLMRAQRAVAVESAWWDAADQMLAEDGSGS